MERTLVSEHKLTSDYGFKGKLKGIIEYWVAGIAILGVTRVPQVQHYIREYLSASMADFLIQGLLWIVPIFLVIGTIVTSLQKHTFNELRVYDTGIEFVKRDKGSQEQSAYADYPDITLSDGRGQSSFFVTAPKANVKMTQYDWSEFAGSDVLENNLRRYGNWK
ncbi:hypothetical protein KIMH_11050 [Bombiscardovia apis]|uniref:YcxB-like protein domain-containing protein n=1 Tax=Bombiscardovia apis TaxID=2932182 RepID=A0ABM8BDL2_9BIFI|nr:hypothetical protein [Bombiscardovia apis]BDR54994.1 hypothetical protein KIMH_11050 [Bombiscardovia apis]